MKVLFFIKNVIATLFTYTFGYVFTLIFCLLALLFALFKLTGAVNVVFRMWAFSLFFITGMFVTVRGKENLEKGKGYIFLINHSSFFDIPGMMLIIPGIKWIGREKLVKIPVFGRMLLNTGYIPLNMNSVKSIRDTLAAALERGKESSAIGVFPEGSRSLDGRIGSFKRGFIYLLRNCDLDVVPITLNGFFSFKPKYRFYIDTAIPLEAIIHPPLSNAALREKTDEEIVSLTKSIIESEYKISIRAVKL
ncbi:MAG: 1-acyl-sn-glycerol-3-phosphate acyltransferase [Brevinematales bacterium]|nr:1-acyl-sn-glycerol-3-phosphate acyltransferase [Brevinematales bacterium]